MHGIMMRKSEMEYFLNLARGVSKKSTCLRAHSGAIIVKDGEVISEGCCGAPEGRISCTDLGFCRRKQLNIPRGERYEMCRSVHSEVNAIIAAPRDKLEGSILFLVRTDPETGNLIENSDCCSMCKRIIINSGIETVIAKTVKTGSETPIIVVNTVTDWILNDETLTDHRGY